MDIFQADQCMFLVTPKGYEERTAVVIALNEVDAKSKAMLTDNIREAVSVFGVELSFINLTQRFAKKGYQIYIAREGCYH